MGPGAGTKPGSKPNQTKPDQTKPNQTKPNQTKPDQRADRACRPASRPGLPAGPAGRPAGPDQTKPNQTKQTKPNLTFGGRRRYEFFWALVWSFHDKKIPFLGSKNDPKPRFSNPGPNVHRNRSGGGVWRRRIDVAWAFHRALIKLLARSDAPRPNKRARALIKSMAAANGGEDIINRRRGLLLCLPFCCCGRRLYCVPSHAKAMQCKS